jgi:hypothetical protein
VPIPCLEHLRLQFMPRNPCTRTAQRMTGRFDCRWVLQTRLLRKSHADHYFGSALFKYWRRLAAKRSGTTMCIFLDGKATVPVGPVDCPVSATRRQRYSIGAAMGNVALTACDHDHIPMHIVPSVTIRLCPPDDPDGSFYGGAISVTFKDAIFEASSPMRHVTELRAAVTDVDRQRPIWQLYTDGGGDHRTGFISVHLSLIALFLVEDLDMLVALRTPPYLSALNPAERAMSILNLGLNGVALSRTALVPVERDALISSFNTKKQWRAAKETQDELAATAETRAAAALAAGGPPPDAPALVDFPALAKETTRHCHELLTSRFEALEYLGERVRVQPPTVDADIESLRTALDRLDPAVDWTVTLKKADLLKRPSVKAFYDAHVRETQYCLQLRKCLDPTCPYHEPARLPADTIRGMHWLPMPTLSQERGDGKFKTFEEAYVAENPTDSDRPGRRSDARSEEEDVPVASFNLVIARVRSFVTCFECSRPRLLFSEKQLSSEEMQQLECAKEEYDYSCGGPVFPAGHSLGEVLFVRRDITCSKPISAQYYSAKKFPTICFNCLDDGEMAVEDADFVAQFSTFLPRCPACQREEKYSGRRKQGGAGKRRRSSTAASRLP